MVPPPELRPGGGAPAPPGCLPPSTSLCSGTYEAEGIDYDTAARLLRVEIVPPSVCEVTTTIYSYRPATG